METNFDNAKDFEKLTQTLSEDQKIDLIERFQQKIEEVDQKQEEADDYYLDAEGNKQPNLLGGVSGEEIAKAEKFRKMRDILLESMPNAERNGENYTIKEGNEEYMG